MRFIAILVVLGIVYAVFTRNSPEKSVTEAVAQAEAVAPAPAAATPPAAPMPTALRRPIARTQEVLGQVQQRNGAGEF
jgi:hypothetical protein